MLAVSNAIYVSLFRQVNHWLQAAKRLSTLDHLASSTAWHGIDRKIADLLRTELQKSSREVVELAESLKRQLQGSSSPEMMRSIKRGVISLRERYLKTEETIHFYTVAVNSRTTPGIAALLRACDVLCYKSMFELLQPLGKETPLVLTYIDKGVGASILKAGLRLWDGKTSRVAAIKVTHHNLFRPTSIIHETGHQIAHILGWNEELADAFRTKLSGYPAIVGAAFASWASEIAADVFAFVHTGFAAVASLNDVVSGPPAAVFAYRARDPHPIAYIRVLLNVELCRLSFGSGPWDDLELAFKDDYDINLVEYPSTGLIKLCVSALKNAASILLEQPFRAFSGKPISRFVNPDRVSPRSLERLEYVAGPALFTSHAWIWKECLRLLALNGYKIGALKGDVDALYRQQQDWMEQLGFSIELN